MKNQLLILFFVLLCSFSTLAQETEYVVDMVQRNKLIAEVNKAKGLISNSQNDKAISILLKVNKSDSVFAEVYHEMYKAALLSSNSSDSVLFCLLKGKRIYGDDDVMCFYVAEIHRIRKNYNNAILSYVEAIKLSAAIQEKSYFYADYFKNRAYCYSKIQNYKLAINDYSEYLKYRTNDAIAYQNRAICYSNTGNKKSALEDLNKSLSLGNKSAKNYIDKLLK